MTATPEQALFVFEEWHRRITARDGAGLAALYTHHAVLESPLVPRVLDTASGVVAGRAELDHFIEQVTLRRPDQEELPSLYRTGKFVFDGDTLIWEYPRQTPEGDQLDLVEVMELHRDRIARHRIYWGWRGTQHIIANAVAKATS
jgi:steroid delta-isomerase